MCTNGLTKHRHVASDVRIVINRGRESNSYGYQGKGCGHNAAVVNLTRNICTETHNNSKWITVLVEKGSTYRIPGW